MAIYPTILAGQRITAGLLSSMLPTIINKPAAEDRTSNATLTADTDLQITLAANATYEVTMHIHYGTSTAAGFQTDWTVPTGAGGNRASISAGAGSNTFADTTGNWGVHSFNTSVSHGNRNSTTNQLWLMERGIVTTVSAGTLALRWAQVTSTASATRVASTSTLIVRRLA